MDTFLDAVKDFGELHIKSDEDRNRFVISDIDYGEVGEELISGGRQRVRQWVEDFVHRGVAI